VGYLDRVNNVSQEISNEPSHDRFPVIDLFQQDEKAAPHLVLSALRTAWLLDQVVARALAPFKLHYAQYNGLLLLMRASPEGVRPSSIGEFLCVSRPNVTKLLARLHARALIEERPDPDDGRAIRAFITAAGVAVVERASEGLQRELQAVVESIPRNDAQALQGLLDQFRDGVSATLFSPRVL
jgi:DNA-binding MarR family transcriptional regulator